MDLVAFPDSILTSELDSNQALDESSSSGIPDGWTMHWHPTTDIEYYSNAHLRVVTRENIKKPEILRNVLDTTREVLVGNYASDRCEIFIGSGGQRVNVVNHATGVKDVILSKQATTSPSPPESYVRRKANYWIHIGDYPFHRSPSKARKAQALEVLEIALAQNIIEPGGGQTPFSRQEAQSCLDFLTLSFPPEDSPQERDYVAQTMMIAYVLSNFHFHRSNRIDRPTRQKMPAKPYAKSWHGPITHMLLIAVCFGIPPDYGSRFSSARKMYKKTVQPVVWETFVGQIRKERGDMNVVSGLLLSASVAFLAVPNIINASQFLIIVSMGLSLGCVVMGLNPAVGAKLSEIEQLSLQAISSNFNQLDSMAQALNQHAIILLLSITFFFLSLFTFSVWSVVHGIFFEKSSANSVFFGLAVIGLLSVASVNLRWNTDFHHRENTNPYGNGRHKAASYDHEIA